MRIGVVSDTHNHIANVARIVELLNDAAVDRVVHTGDITQAKTLEVLARLDAPLCGVYGNNDRGERAALAGACERLGIALADPPWEFSCGGREILVVHDPREIDMARRPQHRVILHGHTHRRVVERHADHIVFNPGECAGHLPGHNAVGIVDLNTLVADVLRF
jgi:putative phosphoesterase